MDSQRAVIRAYENGPLLVRGDFQLLDEDGLELDPQRATIALCRCGRSTSKPFCDGSHVPTRKRHRARPAVAEGLRRVEA